MATGSTGTSNQKFDVLVKFELKVRRTTDPGLVGRFAVLQGVLHQSVVLFQKPFKKSFLFNCLRLLLDRGPESHPLRQYLQ